MVMTGSFLETTALLVRTPLAVRRSIPLMAMAGVPLPIAYRPIGLLGWARSMIRQIDAHQRRGAVTVIEGRGWVDDRTVAAVADTLERGFDRLAGMYGSGNAFDLAGWLAGNEADWAQSEEWIAWHSWLLSVASGRIELPLPRSSQSVAKAIIDAGLGRGFRALYEPTRTAGIGRAAQPGGGGPAEA